MGSKGGAVCVCVCGGGVGWSANGNSDPAVLTYLSKIIEQNLATRKRACAYKATKSLQ